MQKNGNYTTVKKGLITGLHVVGNIYEGVTEGMSEAGTGLAKGSAEVVGAKYGKDAGDATYGVMEGARNVFRIVKAPKSEAKKVFFENEGEKK